MMNIDLGPYRGKKIICAVSGGADSMCLLHLLHSAGIHVHAAHFEHGIRGAESVRDALFVKSYCQSEDIPFSLGQEDVPLYAREKGLGIEEAARLLRYRFLESLQQRLGFDCIATAHNLEDNAETLLLNLIRGSGTSGLRGIPPVRGSIVRPLLRVSRREIEQYLAEHNIPHVEDSTNRSDDYSRNFIRHRIMPQILELNPNFPQAAARTAELMRRDEEMLGGLARLYPLDEARQGIRLESFNKMHVAVASRILRNMLGSIPMDSIDDIIAFARGSGYAELSIPGHRLTRDGGRLYFDLEKPVGLPDRVLVPGETLRLPEAELCIRSEIVQYRGEVNDLFKTSYIKYEIICSDICVTGRREGDRLRPAGRGMSKKLKALFVEKGMPVHLRDNVPVIRDENGILMVWGVAIDERAVPGINEKALKISFEEIK